MDLPRICKFCQTSDVAKFYLTDDGRAIGFICRPCQMEQKKKNIATDRQINPDKYLQARRDWKARSIDRWNAMHKKHRMARRAREWDAFVEDVDSDVVWERDKGLCGICKGQVDINENWHLDHIIPLAKGGLHCYDNVQVAHSACNLSKGNRVPDDVWADPETLSRMRRKRRTIKPRPRILVTTWHLDDFKRIMSTAAAKGLRDSEWARQTLLAAVEACESGFSARCPHCGGLINAVDHTTADWQSCRRLE